MPAKIIDGVAIAKLVREEWRERADQLKANGVLPGLAVIIAADNPASKVYVKNKVNTCRDVGLYSEVHEFPSDASEEMVLYKIRELNANPAIHGILVQLPVPPHVDNNKILETISVEKDVDGFHLYNLGALVHAGCQYRAGCGAIRGRKKIGLCRGGLTASAAQATAALGIGWYGTANMPPRKTAKKTPRYPRSPWSAIFAAQTPAVLTGTQPGRTSLGRSA